MAASYINGGLNQRSKLPTHTVTGLERWSCLNQELPPIPSVKSLHVYDFDNTLFRSPLPNSKLWDGRTASTLQSPEGFGTGGWWHNPVFLEATGEGIEKEEPRAWEGFWNEQIVELVRLSSQQEDALTVLLTGRDNVLFAPLIRRIAVAKKLDLDLICLKPENGPNGQRFASTMDFKRNFLHSLVSTYTDAVEIKVYEDRPKHTRAFRDFFDQSNFDLQNSKAPDARKPIIASVVQVSDQLTCLDPVVETAEVQRLINIHNSATPPPTRLLEIKRTVYYTGYLISPADTSKLLGLVNNLPNMNSSDVKFLANNILISHGSALPEILMKVGGIGHKQDWQITGLGVHQNSIWAARLSPLPAHSVVHTEYQTAYIILAHFKSTPLAQASKIQNWQPVPMDKRYILQTTVGEKIQLRVGPESDNNDQDGLNDRNKLKRRLSPSMQGQPNRRNIPGPDENRRAASGGQQGQRNANQNRNRSGGRNGHQNSNRQGGRGGGPTNRGGGAGGGASSNNKNNNSNNKNRGGGGNGSGFSGPRGYKSLDDMGSGNGRYDPQRGEPNYDDYVPMTGNRGYEPLGDGGLPYGK